jgi:mannose-6-phosphate isomerase-like protein (cupin superfamily)
MGAVVTFAELATGRAEQGVATAPITQGDTREMAAAFVRVQPGSRWSGSVPAGSDCYLFSVAGEGQVAAGKARAAFPAQTFATLQEGTSFSVENTGSAPLELVEVIAPPKPGRLSGFEGGMKVAERSKTDIVPVPEQRKQRIYFVGHHGAESERGHGMIVVYDGETNTPLHHHPNADSLFVLLDGAVEFTVNGKQTIVKHGQAAYFPTNDRHSLHTAPGYTGASFLEFHIPTAFKTVMEQ